jgi:hypothetical protein
MPETLHLRLGEERSIHLPSSGGSWSCDVHGMSSAVDVRKLWAADPYPEDDDGGDEEAERPAPDVVFMVRATAPGEATLRFTPSASGESARDVTVEVST